MERGEIWIVKLPEIADGHEQQGTRPYLILATAINVIVVIPLTTNTKALRFPHTLEELLRGFLGL